MNYRIQATLTAAARNRPVLDAFLAERQQVERLGVNRSRKQRRDSDPWFKIRAPM